MTKLEAIVSEEHESTLTVASGDQIAEVHVRKGSKCLHFGALPTWLQDNDYLHTGHRPPLNSFKACFRSIFRIHTETFNIWTHLIGCLIFAALTMYFLIDDSMGIHFPEKLFFLLYFVGAIICLGCSFIFHTVCCHSERVSSIFNKLDYCGIAILIMVSFIPWLYYIYYKNLICMAVYMIVVIVMGISSITVSLWKKFADSRFRPLRATVFIVFGLSGVIPSLHYAFGFGSDDKEMLSNLGWLILMGSLYVTGAVIYAFRIPERIFPGKCDIFFQSHQIFHVCVVLAAFVHYHAICQIAIQRGPIIYAN